MDWECPSHGDLAALGGVIASAQKHPQPKKHVETILSMCPAQFNEPQLARDMNPRVRGPSDEIEKMELRSRLSEQKHASIATSMKSGR